MVAIQVAHTTQMLIGSNLAWVLFGTANAEYNLGWAKGLTHHLVLVESSNDIIYVCAGH